MKKTLQILAAAGMALSLMISVPAMAEEPAYANVVLNGKAVSYSDPLARPQIINAKTMVPFRDYAEALDIVIAYDENTKTMSFSKDGKSFVHVSGTSIATINGVQTDHITPSGNISGYTMMPVTMLLDAIGAEYEWDDATKTLNIVTTPAAPAVAAPAVVGVSANPPSVDSGAVTKITVIANAGTEKVKLLENGTNQIAESTTYTINNDATRSFIIDWTPVNQQTATGFMAVKAVAGNASGYSEDLNSTKSVSVIVKRVIPPRVNNVDVKKTSIIAEESVNLTVTTNETVEKVKLTNDQNSTVVEATTYATVGDERRFALSVKLSKTGTAKLTVEAAGMNGYDASLTKTATVTVKSKSNYSDSDVIVENVSPTTKKVAPGGTVTIKVNTTLGVKEVRAIADDGSFVRSTSPTTTNESVNQKVWELKLRMPDDAEDGERLNYKVYGTGDSKRTGQTDVNIDIDEDAEDYYLEITKEPYDKTVKTGNSSDFSITTTYAADRLKVDDMTSGTAKQVVTMSKPTSTSAAAQTKKWDFDVEATTDGTNTFRVTVYDSNGDYITKDYGVYASPSASGGSSSSSSSSSSSKLIKDFYFDEDDYYYGDTVEIEVETTTDVERVWVEEPNGDGKYSRDDLDYTERTDDETSNTLTWILSFKADYKDSGTIRYKLYAENDDGDIYEMTATVTLQD